MNEFSWLSVPKTALPKNAASITFSELFTSMYSESLGVQSGHASTKNVTLQEKAIADRDLLARGSEAFFYLYLSTVRGFKVVAPEDVSPASIQNLFSVRSDIHVRASKGYFDRSWILIRTEETFDADPLYIKGENVQCDESIGSSDSYRKYHWVISDKNKQYVEDMKEIRI